MKIYSLLFPFLLSLISFTICGQKKNSFLPDDIAFEANAVWMKDKVEKLMKNNRGVQEDGTVVFYADGTKHYNLIFTRGFSYVYQFAGHLIDHDDAKSFLNYQLAGQRSDGCMPDRVNSDGIAIYSPGPINKPLADHALDNGAFIALSVCRYTENSGDLDFFKKHEFSLRKGLDFINRAPNGLVFNPTKNPQCVYGFTDIVKKTGHLLFSSVLYYEACLHMEKLCRKADIGEPDEYARRAKLIKQNLRILWDKNSGAFYAASGLCRQYDVWGTAFVLNYPELLSPEQKRKALDFLVDNYSSYAEKGQIRHLLFPETWQSTFEYRASGVYQNGGYWATPLAWFIPAIAQRSPELAKLTLNNCLQDFRQRGIYEWVNGGVKVLPNYFVSATTVYSLVYEK